MRCAATEPVAAAFEVIAADWTRFAVTVVEDVADDAIAASLITWAEADADELAVTVTEISFGSMP